MTKEVPSLNLLGRFHGFMDPCSPCSVPCPKTITYCKKERVCETVCEPVTVCKKVAHCVPVTKQVCSYECVTKTVMCPVTTCVKECVTTMCPVTKCVKECVTTMVPVCKTKCVSEVVAKTCTVNVCKMVPTVVVKQVLVSNGSGCGNGCGAPACGGDACGSKGCFSGFGLKDKLSNVGSSLCCKVQGSFAKIRSLGHRSCAAPSCDLGCGAAPACDGCK